MAAGGGGSDEGSSGAAGWSATDVAVACLDAYGRDESDSSPFQMYPGLWVKCARSFGLAVCDDDVTPGDSFKAWSPPQVAAFTKLTSAVAAVNGHILRLYSLDMLLDGRATVPAEARKVVPADIRSWAGARERDRLFASRRRSFHTGDGLTVPNHYYALIPPKSSGEAFESLMEACMKKQARLVHAPRQSGKTTMKNALVAELNKRGVKALELTLNLVDHGLVESCVKLRNDVHSRLLTAAGFGSDASYTDLLAWRRRQEQKEPIALFIDEIDQLFHWPVSEQTKFPSLVRSLNDELHLSVVCFGTIRAASMRQGVGSPFNVAARMVLPRFTLDEMRALFDQARDDGVVHYDDALITHLYELTCGHKAMATKAGEVLQEYAKSNATNVTVEMWKSDMHDKWLGSLATMTTLIKLRKDVASRRSRDQDETEEDSKVATELNDANVARISALIRDIQDNDDWHRTVTNGTMDVELVDWLLLADMGILDASADGQHFTRGPPAMQDLAMSWMVSATNNGQAHFDVRRLSRDSLPLSTLMKQL